MRKNDSEENVTRLLVRVHPACNGARAAREKSFKQQQQKGNNEIKIHLPRNKNRTDQHLYCSGNFAIGREYRTRALSTRRS
jgi:hypothetical protein